jgi:pyruvate/2-oxoglutarate dehydrogenase complex dihydrolipoamide acyltransferase (E2) component
MHLYCSSLSPRLHLPACLRRVKMTRLRMRVAERLKGAQNTYAMLTTFNEVDMTNIMALRNTYKVGAGAGAVT